MTLDEQAALRHRRGRKSPDVMAAMPHPPSRQRQWEAMRKLKVFGVADIEHATRIRETSIASYLVGLMAAGYVVREPLEKHRGRFAAAQYRLVRDVGVEAPAVDRQGRQTTPVREAVWRAMRGLKSFTLRDLKMITPVSDHNAAKYVSVLCQAGYLRRVSGSPGHEATYQLVPARNSGPQAPILQAVQQLWDPNLGRVVWEKHPRGDA